MDKITKLQLMKITGWTEPTALKFMAKHGDKVPTARNHRWEVDAVHLLPYIGEKVESASAAMNELSKVVSHTSSMADTFMALAISFENWKTKQEKSA